jgi:hypothetical protein
MIRHGDIFKMYKGRVPSTQGSVDERYSQVSLSEGLNLKVSSTPSLRRLSKRCCSSDHIDCELFSLITTLLSSHNNPAAIFSLPLRTTNVHPRAECFPYLVQLSTFGNTFYNKEIRNKREQIPSLKKVLEEGAGQRLAARRQQCPYPARGTCSEACLKHQPLACLVRVVDCSYPSSLRLSSLSVPPL